MKLLVLLLVVESNVPESAKKNPISMACWMDGKKRSDTNAALRSDLETLLGARLAGLG
jgi:hypothetical protein